MKWNPMDRTNETCNLCGCHGAHYCTGKQSPETFYSAGSVEDKSWNEFIEWIKINTAYIASQYDRMDVVLKIGLLIEYLKSKDTDKVLDVYKKREAGFQVHIKDLFTVENLELWVKELKPVDEVEELARELKEYFKSEDEYNGINITESWISVARKAIEIIKGKA